MLEAADTSQIVFTKADEEAPMGETILRYSLVRRRIFEDFAGKPKAMDRAFQVLTGKVRRVCNVPW